MPAKLINDVIKKWIPVFGKVRVLKLGATTLDDTEALQHDITTSVTRQSGSSGVVTTHADVLRLMQQLTPSFGTYLKSATLADMLRDQLPPERCIQVVNVGVFPSLGFGLGVAAYRCCWRGGDAAALGLLEPVLV